MDLESGSERLQAWGGAVIAPGVYGESLASQACFPTRPSFKIILCISRHNPLYVLALTKSPGYKGLHVFIMESQCKKS